MRRKGSLIYLVGFMGSGKTTVGRALAQALGREFIDLDELIVAAEGKTIADIFRERGEPYFRDVESKLLASIPEEMEAVVALGGGTFCFEDNKRLVKESGISIWLDCAFEELVRRIPQDGSRPLFRSVEDMRRLLVAREPHYGQADFRVKVSHLPVEAVVEEIIRLLRPQMAPDRRSGDV